MREKTTREVQYTKQEAKSKSIIHSFAAAAAAAAAAGGRKRRNNGRHHH